MSDKTSVPMSDKTSVHACVQTGHTFEREAIERHLNIASSCPVSGVDVKDKTLRPNHALRNAIDDYRAKKVASHRQPESRRSSELNEVARELKRMRARLNQVEAAIQGQAGKDQQSDSGTDQLPQAAGSGLDVRGMTVLQIKEKLRERGLAVSGNKDVLVRRLEDATMDKETCKKAAGMQDEIISPWSFIETVCECMSEC